MIIPSIDIMDGRAVQLRRGREHLLTDLRDPVELASVFGRYGSVAVVDLDAALERGSNTEVIAKCCRVARCRVGGGIRTADDVRAWVRRGADKVVIGTMASPEFLRDLPREWAVAALDARGPEVVVRGWTEGTGRSVIEQARLLAPYCSEFLYTQVQQEGMLGGCDLETALALKAAVDVPITVAGGISSVDEARQLTEAGFNCQLGRAMYEGRIDLAEAWVNVIAFDSRGLVPTIAQDDRTGDVLMLAYSRADSLRKALETGQGWYYSRSRDELWRKGATSGNVQRLVSAAWDCDRDAILFRVEQTGPTCHLGRPTCFGDRRDAVLRRLEGVLDRRKREGAAGSYTCKLLRDADLVAAKLREETEEVIEAEAAAEVAWECADLLYHMMVRMRAADVPFDAALCELRSRFKQED